MTSFRLLFLFVALLQQSEGFRFRSVCSYSRVNLNTLLSVTVNEGDPNEADVAQSSDDNESKIVDLAGNLVKALQEGREEDLKEAGLKIGKKSSRLVMDENLSSGEAIEKILGPVDEEQLEIMSSLSNIQAQGDDYDIQVDKDINPDRIAEQSLLDDIQAEGLAVASQIQSQGSGIGSLLKDRDNESSEFDVTLDVLSSSSKPSQAVKEVTPGKIENTDLSSTALDSIAVEAGLSEAAKQDAQTTFTNLLKVTMDAAQETGANNFSEEDMRKAVAAVSTGNMETLDVKSVIGESLSMLTDQLGIDMNAEVKEGAMKNDMQAIISISMAELASNMAELDAQSEELYQKLNTLQEELKAETTEFDEKKSGELENLLREQASLQSDLDQGRVKVEASTKQLEGLMENLEENADWMTALALFPVKRVDKKMAFILGLATVFKTPYDLSQMFAVRSFDASDALQIIVQFGLIFVFFSHYGLVKALGKDPNKGVLMPPPPE